MGCSRSLALCNRQRHHRVNLRLLRQVVEALLQETWPDGSLDLGINFVSETEITRLNTTFLRHRGSTDVITFDYTEKAQPASRLTRQGMTSPERLGRPDARPAWLHGEIFVCVDEAVSQARRLRVAWQSELVRYIVHGLLHLLGHDDGEPRARRVMKSAEDVLVRQLARQFNLRRLDASVPRAGI
jgi:probable rRNA maturation factor